MSGPPAGSPVSPVGNRRYRVHASEHRGSITQLAKKSGASNGAGHKLVSVEPPAKAKTIAGYLARDYVVASSIGHIRDLPQSAADAAAHTKGEAWARPV